MDIEKDSNREAFEAIAENIRLLRGAKFKDGEYVALSLFDESSKELAAQLNYGWAMWLSSKAKAVLEVKPSRHVTLTCAQLREAFMFGAPDKDDQEQLETEMTISWSENGHSGKGYYCYYSDLPEEGAIFLDDVIEAQEQANESK